MRKNLTKKTKINKPSISRSEKNVDFQNTKLMQKEKLKINTMFGENKYQNIQKSILEYKNEYTKNLSTLFSNLEQTEKSIKKTKSAYVLKKSVIDLSDNALKFFSMTDEMLKNILSSYEKNKELFSENELKEIKTLIKNMSLAITMSLGFYRSSKIMVNKIDLETNTYEEFQSNFFHFLQVTNTIQKAIKSNIFTFKAAQFNIDINGKKELFLMSQTKSFDDNKQKYKRVSSNLYNLIRNTAHEIRNKKRREDKKLSKRIIKSNL